MPADKTFERPQDSPESPTFWGTLLAKISAFIRYLYETRLYRAWMRYSQVRGNLLSGGIAYAALFSLVAALTIVITALVTLVPGNSFLRQTVISSLENNLPGILGSDQSDLIDPNTLVLKTHFSITSIVAFIVLLFTALHAMNALKLAIRAIFGIHQVPENPLIDWLRDLLGFLIISIGIILASVLESVNTSWGYQVLSYLGFGTASSNMIRFGSLCINAIIDALIYLFIIRYVSRIRCFNRDIIPGICAFAIISGLLRIFSIKVVGAAANNPLLASVAAVATLLILVNLLSRTALLIAAWIANPPLDLEELDIQTEHANETPNYITLSDPTTLKWNENKPSPEGKAEKLP